MFADKNLKARLAGSELADAKLLVRQQTLYRSDCSLPLGLFSCS
jgi:hypothetical protein